MRLLLACAGALLAMLASPATAQEADCAMLPPAVTGSVTYAGYSSTYLCNAGQPALWHGLPENTASVTRFVFSDGHAMFHRWLTITQRLDGSAFAEVGRAETPYRGEQRSLGLRRFALSAERVAELARLAQDSGTFAHEAGTWDDPEAIFLHCQVLEMERADAAGYRYASVNIGCNRPDKLMPLVEAVIALAGFERVREGWAGWPE